MYSALFRCHKPVECFIFGAGAFAFDVFVELSYLRHRPRVACFVQDQAPTSKLLAGLPVLPFESLTSGLVCASVAIADPTIRKRVVERLKPLDIKYLTIAARGVRLHDSITVGSGSILCSGVVPTNNIVIGDHVHVNCLSTLAHGVRLADFVTVSPGVVISGNVHIGEAAFIGTGATIINGSLESPLTIGSESIVAAGAVVTKPVPPRTMVAGVPAVIKKQW